LQDAVRFLMKEVRRGKLRADAGSPTEASATPLIAASPAAATTKDEIASMRAEIAQRAAVLEASVEDKIAGALDESGAVQAKVKAEMDWFGNLISSRMDEQRQWFEEFRSTAAAAAPRPQLAAGDEPVGETAVDARTQGRRLSQLEERLQLLEHDSVLMLIEELRNDVRKQLRASKKERREESHRQQQSLEKVQDQLQQQTDRTDSKLSALHMRVDEKISGSDSHMLRRTAELAAMIDELMDNEAAGRVEQRRPRERRHRVSSSSSPPSPLPPSPPQLPPQPPQEHSSPQASEPPSEPHGASGGSAIENERLVDQLSEQVNHLSAELQRTRAEMQSMRDAFRGLSPDSISSIAGIAGSVQDEVRALRAEITSLEAVTHEALRVQESEIVAQRRDMGSLADELREVATALEHIHIANAHAQREKDNRSSRDADGGRTSAQGLTSTTSRLLARPSPRQLRR
jgi:hypothetical protein